MISHAYKPIIAIKAKTEPKKHRNAPPRYNAFCLLEGMISQATNKHRSETSITIFPIYSKTRHTVNEKGH